LRQLLNGTLARGRRPSNATQSASACTIRKPGAAATGVSSARAGDVALAQRFFAELSPQSRYRRFLCARKLRREDLEYLTRFELDRHMSVVATVTQVGAEQLVGAAHCVRYALAANVELALVVADAWQGLGLGEQLLTALTRYAGAAGITEGTGSILASNAPMLSLARKLGAQVRSDTDDATLCRFSLALR